VRFFFSRGGGEEEEEEETTFPWEITSIQKQGHNLQRIEADE